MLQKQYYDKILFYFSVVLVHIGFKIALGRGGGGVDGIFLGIGCSPKMQFICLLHVLIKCTMVIYYVPNLFPKSPPR
jgi:hypothetical protein